MKIRILGHNDTPNPHHFLLLGQLLKSFLSQGGLIDGYLPRCLMSHLRGHDPVRLQDRIVAFSKVGTLTC